MATPPRNDQRDRQAGASGNSGKRWTVYIVIAIVVLLIIYLLFGGLFSNEPVVEETPAVESTATDTGLGASGDEAATDEDVEVITSEPDTAADPETAAPDVGTGDTEATPPDDQSNAAEPGADTDASAPGDAQGDDEEVIEIEGDAEVEILDES